MKVENQPFQSLSSIVSSLLCMAILIRSINFGSFIIPWSAVTIFLFLVWMVLFYSYEQDLVHESSASEGFHLGLFSPCHGSADSATARIDSASDREDSDVDDDDLIEIFLTSEYDGQGRVLEQSTGTVSLISEDGIKGIRKVNTCELLEEEGLFEIDLTMGCRQLTMPFTESKQGLQQEPSKSEII